MEIISWNVAGIRSAIKKGFITFVKKRKPDIILLQETKAQEKDIKELKDSLPEYQIHNNPAEKKGYSGTTTLTKIKPIKETDGIGNKEFDKEGRAITLHFKEFIIVNVYVPNSGRGLPRLDYRKKWDKAFLSYLKNLKKTKPVIIGGDFNVAHEEIDLARPKQNYNKTAGYTQTEIDGFEQILKAGFIDTFRELHKKKIQYTYWSYMFNARAKNIGWRLDYFLITKKDLNKVKNSDALPEIQGSDHCPLFLRLSI
ncbi:MAG TPA: exodeoxyribonuclease III [Candidatus Woesearchaeota archaeon]|nr:MAG: exodeoxyribonuclease III [Candidatus Woesearchaeota archaeon]HDD70816.1 exodeoxyribonuclease III [Candidatus Woesearchaeota archaeon]